MEVWGTISQKIFSLIKSFELTYFNWKGSTIMRNLTATLIFDCDYPKDICRISFPTITTLTNIVRT